MLRPTAIAVSTINDSSLIIKFTSDEVKVFDVKPYIKGSWFGKLADHNYFKKVKVNGYSVEWPEGQDICPDELYYNSKPFQSE